jgi:hypothetical protein
LLGAGFVAVEIARDPGRRDGGSEELRGFEATTVGVALPLYATDDGDVRILAVDSASNENTDCAASADIG